MYMNNLGHSMDSIPEMVMRTGVIAPFSPLNARQDIQNVERTVRRPLGLEPGVAPGYSDDYITPPPTVPMTLAPTPVPTSTSGWGAPRAPVAVPALTPPLWNTMPAGAWMAFGVSAAVGAGVGAAAGQGHRARSAGMGALFGAGVGAATLLTILLHKHA